MRRRGKEVERQMRRLPALKRNSVRFGGGGGRGKVGGGGSGGLGISLADSAPVLTESTHVELQRAHPTCREQKSVARGVVCSCAC